MSAPTVCCVMLVNGRPEMTRRAIASFQAQTYERKRLLILDSARECQRDTPYGEDAATSVHMPDMGSKTIGALRNAANWCAVDHFEADLIAHFDSDDWSHPRRLEEQVALLEASGKMCVGYRELLFWDTRCTLPVAKSEGERPSRLLPRNEAWIYRNDDPRWAAGASFLYRRELWEQQPFDDAPHEDQRWWCTPLVSRECLGVSSVDPTSTDGHIVWQTQVKEEKRPRMICQMHPGGTEQIPRDVMLGGGGGVWLRALSFDQHCERTMKL